MCFMEPDQLQDESKTSLAPLVRLLLSFHLTLQSLVFSFCLSEPKQRQADWGQKGDYIRYWVNKTRLKSFFFDDFNVFYAT